jgi:hypothetical protein
VRLLPTWASGYQRAWLVPDILAGVIVVVALSLLMRDGVTERARVYSTLDAAVERVP